MSRSIELDVQDGLARLTLHREHGNAIDDSVVDGLIDACRAIESDPGVGGVLLRAEGKLFCPGLDLQVLIEKDRTEMQAFLSRFNAAVLGLYTLERPVVAALHGHAVAGGCVLALTADWRMLAEGAQVGLAEVKVGVPFPFGVSMILRDSVASNRVEEVALFGRNYAGEDAVRVGLAHEAHPTEGFEEACLERLRELTAKDAYAFRTTKRYLRSATVERIRANDPQFQSDFLDGWFSDSTRARIRELVAKLRG